MILSNVIMYDQADLLQPGTPEELYIILGTEQSWESKEGRVCDRNWRIQEV